MTESVPHGNRFIDREHYNSYMRKYMRRRRAQNKFLTKAEQSVPSQCCDNEISQTGGNRSEQLSYLKPKIEEYAHLSPKIQQVMMLTGCKFMTNGVFCNEVCLRGSPYCRDHHVICYLKRTLRMD